MHEVTTRHFIIATAGHVDHGKSALVKALTGTDPDRLPEEKKRQITIDLGFAELNLTTPSGEHIHAGIVDVPGHEDFVRNMIAGVGSVDLALFVVAADDGWMPQTEEHLQILSYLDVRRAVIALAKSDLGGVDNVANEIRDRLRGTAFAESPIIPTSVRTGDGIGKLNAALASELATLEPQRDISKPRLFVDRAFTLRGVGTVVTGTLIGGRFHRGQSVTIQPQNIQARIRSIQSHGLEIERAEAAMRTALNLPELAVDQIKRGAVITGDESGTNTLSFIAQLEKSPRGQIRESPGRPLKSGSSVYVHHGTSRVAARVGLLEGSTLDPGNKAIAHLKLASPMVAFAGDRFVLRDTSEQHTISGGIVVNPDGRESRDPAEIKLFSMRGAAPDDVDLWVRTEIALRRFVPSATLLNKSHFTADEISNALVRLRRNNQIVLCGDIAADRESWRKLRTEAIALIDSTHTSNPERGGLDLNELRGALGVQPENVFEALMAELCAHAFVRKGSTVARASHRAALAVELQPLERKIRQALSQKPFDAPPRREIEANRAAQQVLRFLLESGEAIELGADAVLLRENFERMKAKIMDFISENGASTVSELRQALGSSRRIVVPLLERLDREGVTQRVGDKRCLRIRRRGT
jgi:selenocysteine-specific elongation factor